MSSSSINNNQPLPSPPSNNIPENTKLDEVEQVIDTSSLFRSKKRSRANPSTSTNAGGNLRKRGRDATGSTLGVSRGSSGWDDEVTHSAVVQRDDKRSSANRNSFHNGKGAQEEGDSLEEENGLHVLFKADSSASLTSTKRDNISGATAVNSLESGTFNIEGNDVKVENVAARTDSSYSGQSGYNTYLQKREGTGDSKMKAGPIRAPSHLRVTSRFDYQPDICKDYKETGFCGYGDSCKFLHDRGDYKAGWQLDQEWEEAQKMKLKRQAQLYRNIELGETGDQDQSDNDSGSGSDDEEELPFACLICRQPFVTPVVTKCGHYFCERCALKNHVATPKCFACGANTQGIFDVAKKLLDKLDQAKACNATDCEGSHKNDDLVEDEPIDEF